ncbi:MAG: hypothetical protein JSS35_08160, partial [Proteobacteria bacterium]|nr:hypothetical protein [Pseudomonadota bacterium]
LSACIWDKLPSGDRVQVLAAYRKSMAGGAAALDQRRGKLKTAAVRCGLRGDVHSDWISTMAGAEAVQIYVAGALKIDRAKLDAALAAAPPKVAACISANGRLAYYPNGTGCTDPTATAWLMRQVGIDPRQQPAAQQAGWYFNARSIGDWGDKVVTRLPPKPR